jgi:23S rRNA pseudouridine2605 synthase
MASEGLILVTNDGELANQLTHPRHGVEKIYEVQVAGQPEPDVLAQIKRGVHLAEGFVHAVDVRVKGRKKGSTILEMVLDEGRNREIRRLLARVGHKVQRLVRVAVGPIRLGDMPRGAVRLLTREEVSKLRAAAAGGRRPATAAAERPQREPGGREARRGGASGPPIGKGGLRAGAARKPPRKPTGDADRRVIGGDAPPTDGGAQKRRPRPGKRPGGRPGRSGRP